MHFFYIICEARKLTWLPGLGCRRFNVNAHPHNFIQNYGYPLNIFGRTNPIKISCSPKPYIKILFDPHPQPHPSPSTIYSLKSYIFYNEESSDLIVEFICSYLKTTANISPPSFSASQRFFRTATLRQSHRNLAYKLVWMTRPMPSRTIRSTCISIIVSTRDLLRRDKSRHGLD